MTSTSDNSQKSQYDKVTERIDMKARPNLMGNAHQHIMVIDPTDETEDYVAWKCLHCPMGTLITKHETTNDTPD